MKEEEILMKALEIIRGKEVKVTDEAPMAIFEPADNFELPEFRRKTAKDFAMLMVAHRLSSSANYPARLSASDVKDIVGSIDLLIDELEKKTPEDDKQNQSKEQVELDSEPEGITLVEQDGMKWVRIRIYDEDFMLCTKNLVGDEGKTQFQWQEAIDEAEKHGYTLPNKKQWDLIDAYREQIDKLIEEADGDSLADCFWSVARYTSDGAWLYYGDNGGLSDVGLYYTCSVRPLAYFKKS